MSFQNGAFQPDAFQTADFPPLGLTALIHDGNETVMLLHEQGQHVDFLGTVSQAPPINTVSIDGQCNYPVVNEYLSGGVAGADPFSVPLPPSQSGDRLLIIFGTNENAPALTASGWNFVTDNRLQVAWRNCDGSEGSSVSISGGGSRNVAYFSLRIEAGTFDSSTSPEFGTLATATSTTPDPPSLTTSWGAKETLWFAAATRNDTDWEVTDYPSGWDYIRGDTSFGSAQPCAIASKRSSNATEDPGTFTISASATWYTNTIAIRGYCPPEAFALGTSEGLDSQDFTDTWDYGSTSEPLVEDVILVPDFTLGDGAGLDSQDFTDTWDYGFSCDPAIIQCISPDIVDITVGESNGVDSTSHTVTLPGSIIAGQRLLLLFSSEGDDITWPSGWTDFDAITGGTNSLFMAYRDADGSEGASVNVSQSTSRTASWAVIRIERGTFSAHTAPQHGVGVTSSATTGWSGEPTIWIAVGAAKRASPAVGIVTWPTGYNDNRTVSATFANDPVIFIATKSDDASSADPSQFTFDTSGSNDGQTVAILGWCYDNPLPESIALDNQDFTDLADYGFSSDPTTEDFVVADKPFNDGLDDQDWTDFSDYGSQTDQPIGDNNPEVAPSALDDQDFTDYTDYSSYTAQPIDDNNPEVAPSALDDQDFTDYADYGSQTDQPIDDFVLVEEFALGLGYGLDDQDFTDTADYGSQVDPLAGDVVDFNLGTGAGLDEQDFTDTADYGFNIDPPIPDNNPDVGPSALDDQDFTDTSDYGYVGPVPVDDNNPDVCVAAIALDSQDFTDTADYGFSVDPLSDSAPEDFVLGDGAGLDHQDFTDREDYGSQTAVLSEDATDPFPLGTIYDSNDEIVNYFDLSDYSYIVPSNINDLSVLLPNYTVYVLPSDACQLVVVTWNYTTEPSPSWSEITQPSSSWSEVAQPAGSWNAIGEPSSTWSIIIDPAQINWNQVC